ncbi:histidine phosphatase family protein [Myxococcota bacterium]|nr:histidine phosphatase family protein [Myxococcota bacterium]
MSIVTLYLVRHEEAEPGYDIPDSWRALTGKGRRRMRETGKLVVQHADIDVIFTSPLVRAVQTAEILAHAIGLDEPVHARDVIANPPRLQSIVDLATETDASVRGVAIVGHEPTLGELAAELLGIPTYPRGFKKGSVLAVDYDRVQKSGELKWLILGKGPELLHSLEE